ncbi:hypothetical protein KS4_02550 [Poriferisphaera corsica]|uniref:Uncharacterized protein n=2 Tax=Poriferisphaera corsica TaxID=2528020 RepID=A0A517YPS0_9BACT|nr:hypothetical protein KS4_02550 [Poriferisphaera corsica]
MHDDTDIRCADMPDIFSDEQKPMGRIGHTISVKPILDITSEKITLIPMRFPVIQIIRNAFITLILFIAFYIGIGYFVPPSFITPMVVSLRLTAIIMTCITILWMIAFPLAITYYTRSNRQTLVIHPQSETIELIQYKKTISIQDVAYIQYITLTTAYIVKNTKCVREDEVDTKGFMANEINLVYDDNGKRRRINIARSRHSLKYILKDLKPFLSQPVLIFKQKSSGITIKKFN